MEWIRLNDFDSYEISDSGLIRNILTGHILKPSSNHGYQRVKLFKDKKSKNFNVHRLVAQYFILKGKPVDDKLDVNHIDGDKSNNHLSNLEIVTHKENVYHALENNLVRLSGENQHNSILKLDDVEYIRANYKRGDKEFGANALAKKFNISTAYIWEIVTYRRWNYNDKTKDKFRKEVING